MLFDFQSRTLFNVYRFNACYVSATTLLIKIPVPVPAQTIQTKWTPGTTSKGGMSARCCFICVLVGSCASPCTCALVCVRVRLCSLTISISSRGHNGCNVACGHWGACVHPSVLQWRERQSGNEECSNEAHFHYTLPPYRKRTSGIHASVLTIQTNTSLESTEDKFDQFSDPILLKWPVNWTAGSWS